MVARRLPALAALLAWSVLAIIAVAKGITLRTVDFPVFHTAGARFVEGSALYRDSDGEMPFKYAPFVAPLFVPFASLPMRRAAAIWNVAAMVALAWAARAALGTLRDADEAQSAFAFTPEGALWAGAILLHPLFFELSRGQADLFVLAAVVGAATFADKRPWLAGALAATAVGLKLPAALVVLYLVRFRHWRALGAAAVAVAALQSVVLLRYGFAATSALHHGWRHVLSATTPEIVIMSTQGWIPLVLGATGLPARFGMLAIPMAGAAAVALVLLLRRAARATWFAALALAMAGLSPLCWNPNYVLAWPALVVTFNRARLADPLRKWAVLGAGVAAAGLLTTLTPGIVSVALYQRVLWTYRPYAWLSLSLLAAVIGRPLGADASFQGSRGIR
jgi:Glycosyltransferase family 87